MVELKTPNVKGIIKQSLKNSMSYQTYRNLVSRLVKNGATTGEAQTDSLINYTILNDRRMKRWDKTVKISEQIQNRVASFNKKISWIVLTESWCGDAAHLIPVMNKISELNSNIDFRVVLRDENEDLMNAFLTNESKSIPKLISVDNTTGEVLGTFGPRPSKATNMVNTYKAEHRKLTPDFKEELQRWYNKDKGQTAIKDLLKLLNL